MYTHTIYAIRHTHTPHSHVYNYLHKHIQLLVHTHALHVHTHACKTQEGEKSIYGVYTHTHSYTLRCLQIHLISAGSDTLNLRDIHILVRTPTRYTHTCTHTYTYTYLYAHLDIHILIRTPTQAAQQSIYGVYTGSFFGPSDSRFADTFVSAKDSGLEGHDALASWLRSSVRRERERVTARERERE